ncbi:MAG: ribosome biogenesis GTPase Der [Chloroflexota bacterium]
MGKPMVAIVGRQNVGKSTLFNRVVGKPQAIVADLPGTTRDRVFASAAWEGAEFTLVDTGGLEFEGRTSLAQAVREQVKVAIAEADVILFLVDVREGLLPADQEIAQMLRRSNKPIVLVANKADNERMEAGIAEFYRLGLGEPVAVSAHHGRNIRELMERLVVLLPPTSREAEPAAIKLAIVGRPNVGKSMLLNTLVGEERAIVDQTPGTTRDVLDTRLDFEGQTVILIDTAGIRRRGRVGRGVEQFSVLRALRAVDRADVVLLVLDATELLAAQDMHVAGYIQQAAKGIVIIVNKWDLVAGKDTAEYDRYIRSQLKFLPYASVLYTSAKTREGVEEVLPLVLEVYQERNKEVPTPELKSLIRQALAKHVPLRRGGRQLKIMSATQAGTNPPTFVFQVNDARLVHFSYRRYLENRLRQAFGFQGTPLRLVFKRGGDRDSS